MKNDQTSCRTRYRQDSSIQSEKDAKKKSIV